MALFIAFIACSYWIPASPPSLLMLFFFFFFFHDTATTEIYTLSLHDALPIFQPRNLARLMEEIILHQPKTENDFLDRKSTRLNSSHTVISYAVFCLKKKTLMHRGKIPRPQALILQPRYH